MSYANRTTVSVTKSKSDIERVIRNYGADQIMTAEDGERAMIAFRIEMRHVRFIIPLVDLTDQQCRSRWRGLLLVIKAKFESLETDIECLEEAFMAQIVMPDGKTVSEHTLPLIEKAYIDGKMPKLLPSF